MKLKMKKRITQKRRQQRSVYEMLNRDRPIGATHFDSKHSVFNKKENCKWFYFESTWLDGWVETKVKVDLIEIEVLV